MWNTPHDCKMQICTKNLNTNLTLINNMNISFGNWCNQSSWFFCILFFICKYLLMNVWINAYIKECTVDVND